MSLEVSTVTQFTENFIPFEMFIIVFIFAMIVLIISFLAKKNNIVFASLSCVLSVFMLYSTFFLRWNTTYIISNSTSIGGATEVTGLVNVNEMFLSTPTLWLLIGIFAFSVISLWISVANYAKESAQKALKENKELEDSNMVY